MTTPTGKQSAAHTPTAGNWFVNDDLDLVQTDDDRIHGGIICDAPSKDHEPESYAAWKNGNARLIAEAGTVAHETGLTPRQLADRNAYLEEEYPKKYHGIVRELNEKLNAITSQRNELLEALKAQNARDRNASSPFGHDCEWCAACVQKLENLKTEALAKAQQEGV